MCMEYMESNMKQDPCTYTYVHSELSHMFFLSAFPSFFPNFSSHRWWFLSFLSFFWLCVCSDISIMSDFVWPHGRDLLYQAPLSTGFSRQEYWGGLPFPPSRIFPTQRLNPHLLCLLHCRQILYHWAAGKAPPLPVRFYISVFFCAPQSRSNCISLTGWLWRALHVFLCNLIFRCHTSSFLLAFFVCVIYGIYFVFPTYLASCFLPFICN